MGSFDLRCSSQDLALLLPLPLLLEGELSAAERPGEEGRLRPGVESNDIRRPERGVACLFERDALFGEGLARLVGGLAEPCTFSNEVTPSPEDDLGVERDSRRVPISDGPEELDRPMRPVAWDNILAAKFRAPLDRDTLVLPEVGGIFSGASTE